MSGIRIKNGPGQGQTFGLGERPLIVGRDESCGLSLQDKGASRQHAEFFKIGDMCFVRDLESKNGTFVNDNRVVEEMLREGDRIQIGGTVMILEQLASAATSAEPDFSEDDLGDFFELRLEDLTAVNVGEGDASSEVHLRALYRLSRLAASAETEEGLVDKALAFIAETLRADGVYLFGRDQQQGGIVTLGSHVPKGGYAGQLSRTIIRKVLQDRRALLVTDASRDDRFSANESVLKHNIHAVLCAPMSLAGAADSALYVAGDDPGISFNERELELVVAMADQIGLALSHMSSKVRRREYLLSAVRMLLRAADVNLPGIRAKNERLAGYMRAIGRAMRLPADILEKLQLAGMLHNYSEMIARKSGATPEKRTTDTVELMERETFFPEIEDIISCQLERYDGSGPKGMLGAEMPLEARIFQVAADIAAKVEKNGNATDTGEVSDLDAAGALAEAVAGISAGAGKLYDPEVAKAVSEAERANTLALPLEEQWRQRRSSRLGAFLHEV